MLKDGRVVAHKPVVVDARFEHLLFDVKGRGELVALGARLSEMGHGYTEIQDGIRVSMAGGIPGPDPIFEAAVAMEGRVEIRHLIPAGRTVEDTFFEAIS